MSYSKIDYLMDSPTGSGRPPQEIIDRGLQDGEMFEDMERDFLQKYLDELDEVYCGIMFRYYDDDEEWEEAIQNVENLKTQDKIDIGDSDEFDDCIILGRTGESYYFFWKHNSGRNDIGRCKTIEISSSEEFIQFGQLWVENLMRDINRIYNEKDRYMIPRDYFYNNGVRKPIIV